MISNVKASSAAYLQQLNSQKKEGTAVRESKEMDKVESLKEQIQNGSYKVDIQKTAEAVAKDLI